MKAKHKISKKIKKNSPFNLSLFLILLVSVTLGVIAVAKSGRSTFELRKKAASNIAPTCLGLSVSPLIGKTPLELTLSCAGVDGNNDITAAEFGLGGDQKRTVEKNVGQYGTITTKVRYDKAGSYVVTCRLKDNNNEWSSIPSDCSNIVKVTTAETIVATPRPTAIPTYVEPTPTFSQGETPTPTEIITPLPTITPVPIKSAVSNDSLFMIGKIVLISTVTILVGLLLKKLISGDE
ncbi:MAG: hypothetical protein AAB492_01480 [Patescibacteria group bacterium]